MELGLLSRELGLENDDVIERYVRYRQSNTLTLAHNVEVVQQHEDVSISNSIAIDKPQGRLLLAGSSIGRVTLFDLYPDRECYGNDARIITECATIGRAHDKSITGVCWYPFDNGMFTSCSTDHLVRVWDTHELENVCDFNLEHRVHVHAFSPSATLHTLIACGTSDSLVRLCDLNSGAASHVLSGHLDSVLSVAWSPSEEFTLCTGSCDKTIRLWDIRKAKSSLHVFNLSNTVIKSTLAENSGSWASGVLSHRGSVNGLVFTDDGQMLVSTGTDGRVRAWDAATGQNLLINYETEVAAIRNKHSQSMSMVLTPTHNRSHDHPLLFHPTSSSSSAGDGGGDHCSISVFNLWDGRLVAKLEGHFRNVSSLAYHPQFEELFSAGHDKEILNWTSSLAAATDCFKTGEKRPRDQEEDEWSD